MFKKIRTEKRLLYFLARDILHWIGPGRKMGRSQGKRWKIEVLLLPSAVWQFHLSCLNFLSLRFINKNENYNACHNFLLGLIVRVQYGLYWPPKKIIVWSWNLQYDYISDRTFKKDKNVGALSWQDWCVDKGVASVTGFTLIEEMPRCKLRRKASLETNPNCILMLDFQSKKINVSIIMLR